MSDSDPTGRQTDAEPVVPAPDLDQADDPRLPPEAEPEAEAERAAEPVAEPEAEPEAEAERAAEPVAEPLAEPEPVAVPAEGAEPVTEPEAESAPVTRGSRRLVAACVVLFVLSVALASLAAVLASRLESERGRRNDVEEAAGRFATALLTYNHDNLDQAKQRVLALSTGTFREEYERAFAGGLDVLIKETKATSAGTVTDIFIGPVDDDTAKAIVVANATTEGTTGTRRSVASYIQLVLVHVGGDWRVDGVTNLNFGQGTTPTTAPK